MKNTVKYILLGIGIVGVIAIVWFLTKQDKEQTPSTVASFEQCMNAGYSVISTNPRQCQTPEGDVFFEGTVDGQDEPNDDADTATGSLIEIYEPLQDAIISSPVKVSGKARGTWYFEASFPVRVVDANGQELGIKPMQAQGEWMTEEFVPFEGEISFDSPTTQTGFVIFEKDNPSGLPENAMEVKIPVQFESVDSEEKPV